MRKHLGIGFGLEYMPLLEQPGLQGRMILDDAIVHELDPVPSRRIIGMRVRIDVVWLAVSRPSGVGDPNRARQTAVILDPVLNHHHSALGLDRCDLAGVVDHGKAGGVIPAVFQTLEPLKQHWSRLIGPDVRHDSTHGCSPRSEPTSRPAIPARTAWNRIVRRGAEFRRWKRYDLADE